MLLQMLLTKPATMITIMINERMMIRIRIMIMVMQTGVFCTSERTAKPCSSRDGPAHVWSVSEVGLKGIERISIRINIMISLI